MTVSEIFSWIKVGAVVLLVVALGGLTVYFKGIYNDNARLTMANEQLRVESASYALEAKANLEALNRREAETIRLSDEKQKIAKQLQEAINADKKTKAWAESVCPDGVVECLLK